jgi:hypothetical protein
MPTAIRRALQSALTLALLLCSTTIVQAQAAP